jgi:diguanylate cyclase (GGDEF)-like protein
MTNKRLGTWLIVTFLVVGVVVLVDSTGVVSERTAIIVDDAAQLGAGLAATLACWWVSRRTTGPERNWRRLMALGMGGWTIGMGFWAYYQIFSDTPLPSPSIADVGFLTLPVFAVPALLSMAVLPSRFAEGRSRRDVLPYVLDGLVVVGSLFIVTWATTLGAVVEASAPTAGDFAVAVAYPVTDLVMVVMVVLLAVTRRVPVELRPQLWLVGSGIIAISLSDSFFAYVVSTGLESQPPLTNAGFIAGPLLIAVAGITTSAERRAHGQTPANPAVERAHMLAPYALVVLTGTVVAVQVAVGADIDLVEASLVWVVITLVMVRQMITLYENRTLLERVTAAQTELAHRAHHDALTGLANRALLGDRLEEAVERYRHGRQFALLVIDLDDLKRVNDNLGHSAGDRVLRAAGQRLRACVRTTDTVARLGGDEFAVVLDGTGDTPDIVSHRVLLALRQPFEVSGTQVVVSASIGVARPRLGDATLTPDHVLHRADEAMYVGKRRGKNMVVFDRPELARPVAQVPPRSPVAEAMLRRSAAVGR